MDDDQLKTEVEQWLDRFMRDSFPVGLTPKIEVIVRDVAMSAYLDGVIYGREWADLETSRKKSVIIKPN